ncbi:MAG TPA: PAS domain-containing protein [Gemmatimonadales bacterium]|nr:PAS domain-containing protein [Gemmatimonadales bacterium]
MLEFARSLEALDRITEGIFALDVDGRFSYVNRTALRLLPPLIGSSGDLLGKIVWEASPSFPDTPAGSALRRATTEGVPIVHSLRDPVSGGMLELRLYPSADGVSGLVLEAGRPRASDVLDRVSDLYLACDDEWRLTLVNARAAEYLRMLGPDRGDPLGRSVWEMIPGLEGSRFQAEAFRALVEQSDVEFEGFFAPLKRWFSVRITPTADGIVACVRDVTGWRKTRRALTRETERLATVIETQQTVSTAGPDLGAVMRVVAERLQSLTWAGAAGVFVPDDGQLVLCEASGSGREQIGLRVPIDGSMIGLCYTTGELIRSDDVSADPRAHPAAIQTLNARSGILVPLKSAQHGVQAVVAIWSGRPRAFNDLHVHTIRLIAGLLSAALERAASFASNQLLLAERTASLAAIEGAEERFRTLVESIDDVVFRLDRDQRCVDIFGRWLQREGFRPADFLGRTTADVVGSDAAAAHERANQRALAGETVTYEWSRPSRRGTRYMQTTLSPLRGARGEVAGIVGVGRDITQRVEAEQQVRQAQKMEAVGRFAGGVAHDLNNMMMIILGFSDFLLASLDHDDARHADADEIRKAAERAMQLTRQLLGFGRHRVVARETLSLNTVVEGMERMLRPLLGEDIALVTALSPGLGGVEADYGQMEQVVMNLALNARDAMKQGGQLTIETIDVDFPEGYAYQHLAVDIPAGPYVLLVVSDTGEGMSPDVKAHLFEPFFTTKPTTLNTGLGLTTVYGIVVQSGGYIWVDTAPDQGCSFKICFPRVGVDDVADPAPPTVAAPARGSETVLLVEDEDAVRALASRVLADQGYVVLEARNGREALAILERPGHGIHLVLTDVVMPDMGGLELTQRAIEVHPGVRIVYMSGYTEGDKLQPGLRNSPYPFLQKPFSAENLAVRIREALDSSGR